MSLSILNVGAGDTKIVFDKDKPEERERAHLIIQDMLKLGYAVLVKVGDLWARATSFDPERDEYIIGDKKKPRKARKTVPVSAPAVAVARSAGGMSDRADSVEMRNIERFDPLAETRGNLARLAERAALWAGIPMPMEGVELVIEPTYPARIAFSSESKPEEEAWAYKIRNRFYSVKHRCDVIVFEKPDCSIDWTTYGAVNHAAVELETCGNSSAWGIEQEHHALQLLGDLLPHHRFKKYLLTGAFIERSVKSGIYYMFRKLRPTVAMSDSTGELRTIACLCMHPIAYYAGTWAGAMCPTDDVIAHLMLMRGDEHMFWKRANQHPAWRPEAGL